MILNSCGYSTYNRTVLVLFLEYAGADPFGTCRAEPASVRDCCDGKQLPPERPWGEHFRGFRRKLPETLATDEVGYPEFVRGILESVRVQKVGCCGTLLWTFPPGHGELLLTSLHHLPRCGRTQVWWSVQERNRRLR